MIKSYKRLRFLKTFEERFQYLDLRGVVGNTTFGVDRYLNQTLYHSVEWRTSRNGIIVRDNGCDLGIIGREIYDKILIHHLNPITMENIERGDDCIFDPDNLICTTHNTHNAIHFGTTDLLSIITKDRRKGDTTLW